MSYRPEGRSLYLRRRTPVSQYDLWAVFTAAGNDSTAYGARDAAAIALLCGTDLHDLAVSKLSVEEYRRLTPVPLVEAAVESWFGFRGGHPGALLNPIRQPDHIVARAISRTALSRVLQRRAIEAKVPPFSPNDIARSRSMHSSRRWFGRRQHSAPHAAPPLPAETSESQAQLVRFLSRFGHDRRAVLLDRLNLLAGLLSEDRLDAFSIDWRAVAPEDLSRSRALQTLGRRQSNALLNALRGLRQSA